MKIDIRMQLAISLFQRNQIKMADEKWLDLKHAFDLILFNRALKVRAMEFKIQQTKLPHFYKRKEVGGNHSSQR